MSATLAAAQAAPVVAQHPVVQSVVHYVQVNHTQVIGGATALLGLASGAGVGFLHRVLERDRLSKQANLVVVQAYTLVLTLLTLLVAGDLNKSLSISAVVQQYGLVLGGNQALYQLLYLYNGAAKSAPVNTDTAAAAPSLPISSNP